MDDPFYPLHKPGQVRIHASDSIPVQWDLFVHNNNCRYFTSQLSGDPEELYIRMHKTSFTGTGTLRHLPKRSAGFCLKSFLVFRYKPMRVKLHSCREFVIRNATSSLASLQKTILSGSKTIPLSLSDVCILKGFCLLAQCQVKCNVVLFHQIAWKGITLCFVDGNMTCYLQSGSHERHLGVHGSVFLMAGFLIVSLIEKIFVMQSLLKTPKLLVFHLQKITAVVCNRLGSGVCYHNDFLGCATPRFCDRLLPF